MKTLFHQKVTVKGGTPANLEVSTRVRSIFCWLFALNTFSALISY